MIDLSNKTIDEVNELIQKYASALELVKPNREIPYLAVIIDVGIKYIKEKHNDLTTDWKAMLIVLLKLLYLKNSINNEANIPTEIENFMTYYNSKYNNYIENLIDYSNDYDKNYKFILNYINKSLLILT